MKTCFSFYHHHPPVVAQAGLRVAVCNNRPHQNQTQKYFYTMKGQVGTFVCHSKADREENKLRNEAITESKNGSSCNIS